MDYYNLLNKYRKELMGISALLVLFFHTQNYLLYGIPGIEWVEVYPKRIAFFGVDVFFFLSGMGLMYSISKGSTLVFYQRRIKRVAVPFIVISIICAFANSWDIAAYLKSISGLMSLT